MIYGNLYFTLFHAAPSTSPLTISGHVVDSNSIFLSWSPPLPQNQNGIIREYIIKITEILSNNTFTKYSTNNSITINSLHPNYYYNLSVSAVTISSGPFSQPITFKTDESSRFLSFVIINCDYYNCST